MTSLSKCVPSVTFSELMLLVLMMWWGARGPQVRGACEAVAHINHPGSSGEPGGSNRGLHWG